MKTSAFFCPVTAILCPRIVCLPRVIYDTSVIDRELVVFAQQTTAQM